MFIRMQCKKVINKNSINKKLKNQYKNSYISKTLNVFKEDEYDWSYNVYPNLKNSFFRRISTKSEASFFEIHEIEYFKEYNIKLRKKRNKTNLPNTLDDIKTSNYYTRNSWKHNSKRKTQNYK